MKIEIKCDNCGSTFEREDREHRRSIKQGRKSFCSRKCCGKTNIVNIPEDKRSDYDISQHASNRKDEFSEVRTHLRRVKGRNKEYDIELQDLLDQWNIQKGVCPYSKIELKAPSKGKNNPITTASLDRIDSNKGYVKGNIQFVSTAINYMKAQMTHEETMELCAIIRRT